MEKITKFYGRPFTGWNYIKHLFYSTNLYCNVMMYFEKKKLAKDRFYSSHDFLEYDRNAPDAFLPDGKSAKQIYTEIERFLSEV